MSGTLAATAAEPEPAETAVVADPYDAVVPYSTLYVVAARFGLTLPETVAPLVVTEPTDVPATDGATSPVVKTRSGPFVVPPALVATRRAWYVVDESRPLTGALAATPLAPEPADTGVVADPYEAVAPYSTLYVVATRFGFTLPETVAPAAVIEPTDVPETDGAMSPVVKARSGPFVVPAALVATRRAC